jgi:hypothetical protein
MKAYVLVGMAFLLALTACGKEGDPAAEEPVAKESAAPDAGAHNGPNGGHVLALGDQGFLEVKTNHMAGTVTMWVYKDKTFEETIPLDEEPIFNFVHKKAGPMQIVGEEYDDSWMFWDDDALKDEFKSARFRIKLNGKNFSPPFVHSHKKPAVTPDKESEGE